MDTVGYAALQVIPSMKGAKAAIEGDLSAVGTATGRRVGTSIGSGLTSTLRGVATTAVAAVATAVGVSLTKGFGRLKQIDQATAKLTGLGHSAKAVDKIMSNALKSVRGTAFGLGDAASVAANAVASGVKPGKDLVETLSLIADSATISGRSLGEMGAMFNKVAAADKIQMDVINQLHDAGVPALALLAKQMGVTNSEAAKLASEGKINFSIFKAAMKDGLGGAAQQSGNTFTGALANVFASLGRVGANLLGGVFPKMAPLFQTVATALGPLEDRASAVGDVIGSKVAPVIDKVMSALERGLPTINGAAGIIAPLGAAFAALGVSGLGPLIGMVPGLGGLGGALSALGGPVGIAVAAFAGLVATSPELRAAVSDLIATLAPAVQQFATSVLPPLTQAMAELMPIVTDLATQFVTGLTSAITTLAPTITNLVTSVVSLIAPLAGNEAAVKAVVAAFVAWKAVMLGLAAKTLIASIAAQTKALWTSTTAWIANKRAMVVSAAQTAYLRALYAVDMVQAIGRYVVSQAALIAAYARQAVVTAATTTAMVAQRVTMVAITAASKAWAAAQWLLNAALSANPIGVVIALVAGLVAGVVLLWRNSETFRTVVTAAWAAVQTAVVVAGQAIWSVIQKVTSVVLTFAQFTPLGFIVKNWRAILSFFQSIPGLIRGVFGGAAGWLKAAGSAIVNGLRSGITGAWSAVTSWLGGVRSRVTGALSGAASWLTAIGRAVITGLRNGITGAWSTVTSWLGGVAGRVKGAIGGAASWLTSAGADVVRGFISGLESMAGSVVSAVKRTITDKLPGFVKKALGIHSPSRVFRAIGKWVPIGLAKGIRDGASGVDAAVKDLMGRLDKAVKKGSKESKKFAKAASTILKAQTKQTKSIWQGGAQAGTDALLASLGKTGEFKKGAAIQTATLKDFAKAREVLVERLGNAQQQLAAAIQLRDDFKSSVVDGIRAYTSLLNAQGQVNKYGFQQAVSAQDIITSMTERLRVAQTFSANMASLLASGLNQQTYKELIEKGPEAAGAYAQALVDGGPQMVGQVNSLTDQINVAANQLGTDSAAVLYQSGVNAAQGLVTGIESQIAAVEAAADRIGKSIAKAVKKALKIKSPSRVLSAIGQWIPAGLAVGMSATSKVRQVTAAATSLASTAADALRSRVQDAENAASAVSNALTVTELPKPRPPYIPPPGGPEDGAGGGGGGYGGPRVVVQQTINNPQAEPTSKTIDAASRTLGLVGAV
ncbi:tape measure protein [Nocardioides sp.]|uniref:tape measure protein n=1 Tax=Nocardioides sp. TaxID=35761 RepID=UPI0039E39BB2